MNCLVLGAGAWGTAMALHLHQCGHAVTLAPRRIEHALDLASSRENKDYLPGYALPQSIQIGSELAPLLMEAEVLFLAAPSKALRSLCENIAQEKSSAWQLRTALTLCKGVEEKTFKLPSEIVQETLPDLNVGCISGPTFASEVADGKPTAVALAVSSDGEALQIALSSDSFRAYLTDDVKGVELGATLKNVYAIAAGLCDGLELGHNAKAALITRSLQEMVKVGGALGGRQETFFGLSGFGDLVATCTGPGSRNRTFGEAIAKGESAESVLKSRRTVTEGVNACCFLADLCQDRKIDAPILQSIQKIIREGLDPCKALTALMRRELKTESK